ncbi:hypothetical protein Tco_1575115 [Tanacetum coccineum]
MPLTNCTSISANLDPVISLAFVEANYDVLESLQRDCRRQVYNEDIRTELDYYSEKYDEEREMEPRLGRRPSERRVEDGGSCRGNLPPLLASHLGRSKNGQPLQSTLTFGYGGNQPSTNSGGNLW